MPLSSAYYNPSYAPAPPLFSRMAQDAQFQTYGPPQTPGFNTSGAPGFGTSGGYGVGGGGAPPPPPVPDIFARYQPPQVNQGQFTTAPPQGPPGFNTAGGGGPPPAGGGGGGNAAQLAQAALLYQMLQSGLGGFLGNLMPGQNMAQQRRGLPGQAGAFSTLQDPSIAAIFDPSNLWKGGMFFNGQAQPMAARRAPSGGPTFGPNPDVYQNALTFLRTLLGIA